MFPGPETLINPHSSSWPMSVDMGFLGIRDSLFRGRLVASRGSYYMGFIFGAPLFAKAYLPELGDPYLQTKAETGDRKP